jgi:glycosyltransferase involved in cell wall biosynthesis
VNEGVSPRDEASPGDQPPAVPGLAVVIPAKDEAARIATTVAAAARIPGVSVVVVVDDGSSDHTGDLAERAGASVVRHQWNKGKGAAMDAGSARVASLDKAEGITTPRALLFLDADLGESAANAGVLAEPVLAGEADMTIAIIPAQSTPGGGSGRVVRLARAGIRRETGWTATQPLSGSRCLTRAAFAKARPLAKGWGVETGLTIDLLKEGFRVVEVPCELHHRVTGTDIEGKKHRASQYRDVWLALIDREIRKRDSRVVLGAVVASRMARSVVGGLRRR